MSDDLVQPPQRGRESALERASLSFLVNGCSTFLAVLLALVVFFGCSYAYVRWEIQNVVNAVKGNGGKK